MFCTKCGTQNDDNNQFCVNCSEKLGSQASPVQQTPVQQTPPVCAAANEDEHVSVGQWIGYFLLNFIPCVGPIIYLVMLFKWGFGDTPKKSLKSFAKAQLILMLISVILSIVVMVIFGSVLFGLIRDGVFDSSNYYY